MSPKNDIELPLLSQHKSVESEKAPDQVAVTINQHHKKNYKEYIDSSSHPDRYASKPPFFQWLTFTDIYPFANRMNKMQKFEVADVPKPDSSFDVESKMMLLEQHWKNELKEEKPQFIRALRRTFNPEITQAIILTLIDNTIKVYYSIYVGDIVSIITSKTTGGSDAKDELIYSATILSALVIVWLFAKNWALYVIISNIGRARLAITGLLYKKLHSTSLTSLHEIKLGKVINLIGNDLNDMQSLHFVPAMLTNPYMIILGTYMMYGYFDISSFIGLGCLALIVFGQIYFSNKTEAPRKENKKTTDERVKLTHELIEGIRLIKMYTWDKLFKQKIEDLRQSEQATFDKMIEIDAISRNFSSLSVYINILVVCIVYVMLGGILSPEKVYASMLILMHLSHSLVASNQGRMGLVNFRMVITRVEEILNVKDILSLEKNTKKNVGSSKDEENSGEIQPVIFKDFTGYWSRNGQKPCLSNINLTFNPGTLTAIIGKIGSGKSSLLLSFLRELPLTSGTLISSNKIAYVEQDPIIFSGTLKENILFGRECIESIYKKVLRDCNLDKDLENFPNGDLTSIGERGVNLSGGQKARVSLARALYSQSDVYLLDDPFSALDSRVARDIFNKVLKGSLARTKIIILVTHHLNFAKESDHVILMDEGKVEAQGSFVELEQLNISLLNVFKIEAQKKLSDDYLRKESKEVPKKEENQTISKTQEKGNKEEATQVSLQTYKDYFNVKGDGEEFFIISSLFIIPHAIMVYFSRFIGYWAEEQTLFYHNKTLSDDASFDNTYYITVSVAMMVVIAIISYIKTIKLNGFMLSTNTELHHRMLNAVVRSKVLFFDINPVGRVLNRFSNDLGILDKHNLRMIFESIENFVSHLALLVTVCIINPIILIPTILVIYGLYRARKFFDKPMILTKKLELASKSPMISYVPATLQGLIIIRAYNQGERFIREFLDMVFVNTKTYSFLTKTTRLFMVSLETPVQCLTVSGVWIFIIGMLYYDFAPGLLGLSLMYLLKIGTTSSLMIRQSLEVDVNMQSTQRILDYCNLKGEAPDYISEEDAKVEKQFKGLWPTKGEIIFNKVFLKYREDLGFALNGLSFKIPGGLKVACIGRTGAGKSSLIQALFRMVEIEKGPNYDDSYIKIDGIDIHKLGLNLLRSRLAIIPQTPVIFTGTIRRNLDPFGTLSVDRLWRILEEIGLKDHVKSLSGQLETDMTISNSVFSTGQKQLICLARAIINKSKVIILDEATANVDVETDNFIQKTIMEKFKECTVLTIAHRLVTIANYDKVVVIDNGYVVEYDTPYTLLVQRIGDSRITRQNGIFAQMVNSTGQGMAKKIFDIAKDHFLAQRGQESS